MYFWVDLVVFVLYRIDFVCFDVVFILHCNVSYCFRMHVDACILQCSFFFLPACCWFVYCTISVLFMYASCPYTVLFWIVSWYILLTFYCTLSGLLCTFHYSLFFFYIYTITISLSYLLILQLTDYIFFMVVATEIVRSKPAFAMQMCDHLSLSEHAGFFHCCIFMFGVEYIHIMYNVHFCLVKFDVCM